MSDAFLLSLIIFLPTVGALFVALSSGKSDVWLRQVGFWVTLATFMLTLFAWLARFRTATSSTSASPTDPSCRTGQLSGRQES